MSNNSDYTKNNTNFYDLLPEVYKNDFTKSMFNNLFNRYVTKDELTHVDGYVGQDNNKTRNIQESTPNRQAYQLQPMLYSKIGTIEHMMTWNDIINEMEKVGINTNALKDWLTPQKFNWVPPLDIDKILHFSDYYWYNPDNPTDVPQYLTIKNVCSVAKAKVVLYEKIISNSGSTYQIINIDNIENEFSISNDFSSVFTLNSVFYTKNASLNSSINNSFWTVGESTYDSVLNITTIKVVQNIVDNVISGEISLNEYLEILISQRDCICNGSVGFDKKLFDDNQIGSILWNVDLLNDISHPTLNDWVLFGNDLSVYDLWYNTTNDTLYQFSVIISDINGTNYTDENNWSIINQNLSVIIEQTDGQHSFDFSIGCTYPRNQWTDQNYWTHKSVIPNFTIAKQAEIPIIEFSPFIEMNEWTCKVHQWSYRINKFTPFQLVEDKPSLFELVDINEYKLKPKIIELASHYGDLTSTFKPDYKFNILNSVGALYSITNITTGFGGTFTVSGDITGEYTDINDLVNSGELPSTFKIRNSPGGLLDQDWTIDDIDILTDPGKSIIRVIPTEVINTFSFFGSELYQTNNGEYNTEYSMYERVKSSYIISVIDNTPGINQITIVGNIQDDIDFINYFYTINGCFTYNHISYDQINNTTILEIIDYDISAFSVNEEIFINEFKTVIKTIENFDIYNSMSSNLVPLTTSLGDVWNSYNTHWVYKGIESTNPISRRNLLPGLSLDVPLQVADSIYNNVDFDYKLNKYVQYYLVKEINGINIFELHESLLNIAVFEENQIRVYIKSPVDNRFIRQYGNYTEIQTNGFVSSIEFNILSPILRYSEVRIEVGPTNIGDIGFLNVNVRTEENDSLYDVNPAIYSEYTNLQEFDKNEQVKVEINQYPLFDVYDTNGQPLKIISKIFKFKEDTTKNINFNLNKRIVVNSNNDYVFEQELIESDNSSLYAYRDNKQPHLKYFVNSITNEILIWNNFTWNNRILLENNYLYPIIGTIEPTLNYEIIEGQIWYNPETNELKVSNGVSFNNVGFEYVTIDPTLKTIWQPGLNKESYDPKYVDKDRVEVPIGSDLGQWEIPDPLYYNVHHENRKEVSLLYLTSHFNTIINSQLPIPGFNNSSNNMFHINDNPNFGLGGTIREYNDGFDILSSAIFINNSTTKKILDFAQNQYSSSLVSMSEILIKDLPNNLINVSDSNTESLFNTIISDTITQFENIDINGLIFSESPSYNGTSGIKNWIATLPMLGFIEYTKPYKFDSDQHLIRHHDGHISSNSLVSNIKDNIIIKVLKTPDTRTDSGIFFGNTSAQYNQNLPETQNDFNTAYNSIIISNGKYWYNISQSKLWRLSLVSVGSTIPDTTFNEGSKYFNTSSNTLYELTSGSWNIKTSLGDGIILSAWELINLDDLNNSLILEIENKLYDVLDLDIDQKLDYSVIKTDPQYTKVEQETFNEYSNNIEVSNPLSQLGIYDTSNPFTWNYIKSDLQTLPYIVSPIGPGIGGCWQDLYEKIYGTAFPHREPWILQGYNNKPTWWDTEYKDLSGNRKWIYDHATSTGMWDNILNGLVPLGYSLPNNIISSGLIGEVKQYDYLSVMIGDITLGIFEPDDILPPFWDFKPTLGVGYIGPIRSLYSNYNIEIIQPNLDYSFGDKGSKEWIWNHSIEYGYDLMKIYYRINPIEFYHKSFGIKYNYINDLQINRDSGKVYSHIDTIFHGSLYKNNVIFKILGINQWYTNYNQYFGIDSNASNFNKLWNDWSTPLTYQLGSFVDTESFDIQNTNLDLVESDLSLTIKKSLGIKESWIDALNISLLKIPNIKLDYDTSHNWAFNVFSTIARDITYYDIKKYPVHVNDINNILTLYKFIILDINLVDNYFVIAGNWTHLFGSFNIIDSLNNDNTYSIDTSTFDSSLNNTIIKPIEPIIDDTISGYIISNYRSSDWETGQEIKLESTKLFPRPLNKTETYFVIKISNNQFKLANTKVDAVNNNNISFDTIGSGQMTIGEITNTFNALSNINSPESWNTYAIDENNLLSFNSNKNLYGIQNCVDIVTGYSHYLEQEGWKINYDNTETDPILGRSVSWQLELEKFINHLFVIQKDKQNISDFYSFSSINNDLIFDNFKPIWETGTKVLVSSQGVISEPLIENTPYYIIRDDDLNKFSLAQTPAKARNDEPIIILSNGDVSEIKAHVNSTTNYVFELNPFRNNIWYNNKQGIISDIIKGPYNDINVDNTIYDQSNNTLYNDKISIYREDSIAKILLNKPIININENHISGFHLFVDGYEHVLFFEKYSKDGFLIYDPYIGLNTARFDLIFDKQSQFSLRPNIGGKFLTNKTQFISNIESLTKNLQEAYSTYSTSESNTMTQLARNSLGYDKTEQLFLDKLYINDKSQFIFWKGLIQHKGSTNTITAFINSRRFVDAKLDEFWCYKIGTFGDNKTKVFPELKIQTSDTLSNELKMEFIKSGENPETNFTGISINDSDKWFEYPNQNSMLNNVYGDQFYFNAEITNQYLIDPIVDHNGTNWTAIGPWYFKTQEPFDTLVITYETITSLVTLTEGIDYNIINSKIVEFIIDPKDNVTYLNINVNILNVAKTKHNPLKIIDYKSDIKLLDVPIWNPAKGHNYHISDHLIDLKSNDDPAEYTDFENILLSGNELDPWKAEHNKTIWLDDSMLDYYPYYDTNIESSTVDRIINWGKHTDYSTFDIYEWTETKLHPTEWNDIAKVEELDKTIPENIRRTGRIRECVYNVALNKYEKTYKHLNEYHILDNQLNYQIESIIFNDIERIAIEDYIDSILPQYNIKGYINGIFEQNVLINPDYGKRVINFNGLLNPNGLDLVGLIAGTYEISINELNTTFNTLSIIVNGAENWNTLLLNINSQLTNSIVSITNGNIEFKSNIITNDSLIMIEESSNNDLFSSISNYQFIDDTTTINIQYKFNSLNVTNKDLKTIVWFAYDEVSDDGTRIYPTQEKLDSGEYLIDVPFSKVVKRNNNTDNILYYYWIKNKTIKIDGLLSMKEIKSGLINIPIPYTIIQKPILNDADYPNRYTQLIIKGLSNKINDNNRYKIIFTNDFTLRDNLDDSHSNLSLKNVHEEWKMFREKQQYHIDRYLWDKVIESVIGKSISNNTRIPLLDKELYDIENNTETRYGLNPGQIFIDRNLAIEAIYSDLYNSDNDFYPVNIDSFVQSNNFNDEINSIKFLESIYNSFASEHLNRIFFSILHIALSRKLKYDNIMKTSMISLHGIKILDTNGIYDD